MLSTSAGEEHVGQSSALPGEVELGGSWVVLTSSASPLVSAGVGLSARCLLHGVWC